MDMEVQRVQPLEEELEVVLPQVLQRVQTVLIILAEAAALVPATMAAAAEAAAPRLCLVIKDTPVLMAVSDMAEMVEILRALPLHTLVAAAVLAQADQAMSTVRSKMPQPIMEM